jgi:transposase
MGYPSKRKAAILLKMLPPNNKPIAQLAIEEGIAQGTLYSWRVSDCVKHAY